MFPRVFANLSELEPFQTVRGVPYHPLWRAMPVLEPTYLSFEKSFNAAPAVLFLYEYQWLPPLLALVYLTFCFAGPRVMANRKAFDLRGVLACWNLCLAAVSVVGAFRVGSHLLFLLSPWGGFSFRDTLCRSPEESYGDNATGLWCVIFTASKVLELLDTVFVVLRKKPLTFLHWYHSTVVLLVSWFVHTALTPALWFMAFNYSVDAAMRLYLGLQAFRLVPAWLQPAWITAAQLSQMFIGIAVTASTLYYKFLGAGGPCPVDSSTVVCLFVTYESFLCLFLEFLLRSYLQARRQRRAMSKAQPLLPDDDDEEEEEVGRGPEASNSTQKQQRKGEEKPCSSSSSSSRRRRRGSGQQQQEVEVGGSNSSSSSSRRQ